MRVIFLTHNFPRFPGDVSGAFLAVLARALRDRGVEVRVIAPSDRGEVGPSELEGIPVSRVRYASADHERLAYRGTMAEAARTPRGALAAWSLIRALRGAAGEEIARGADLVHAHWWVPAGLAAPRTAPLVITVHGTDAALLGRSRLARVMARRAVRRAAVLSAVSASAAALVARGTGRGIGAEHIQAMPVETSWYEAAGRGGGGLVSVGRLTRQKRVDLALRALAMMDRPELPLTIVGDGPEREPLETLADSLGLSHRVRFLGALPPREVAAVLATADLAVFPAVAEGFGLAAAEALMLGVPVVACRDGGGVLSVVPERGAGRHADPSPESIAQAVSALLADAGARDAARAEGVRWRGRLSPAHVAEVCERWYREALGA